MLKRGIVISPPFEPLITGGIRCGGEPDPIELRNVNIPFITQSSHRIFMPQFGTQTVSYH